MKSSGSELCGEDPEGGIGPYRCEGGPQGVETTLGLEWVKDR